VQVSPPPSTAPSAGKTYSWWFTRNTLHQVPATNQEVAQLLAANQAFYVLPNNSKKIYLTFDCGYELGYTPKILDVLDRQQVKAIFFITGQFIKTQPELVKRMHSSGHLVGNHTFNHPDLPTLSQTSFNQEINSLAQKYTEVTGAQLDHYLRPPNGTYSAATLKWAQELGYTTVFWSMAFADWDPSQQPGAAYAHQHVLDNIHPGAVILLHVVSQSDTDALEGIITDLKAQGYVFSTFPQ
jgi:peptidoglycan-N-acetylmuramic acid deacetylase